MIHPILELESISAGCCGRRTRGKDLTQTETKTSEVTTPAFTELPFSVSGRVTPLIQSVSRTLNPLYALFNCTIKATETAALLETGSIPDLRLTFPNRPRPLRLIDLIKKFPMVYEKDKSSTRSVIYLSRLRKPDLELIMQMAGRCHAIVAGYSKTTLPHAWNYVKETTQSGDDHFVLLDSYSTRHHDKGIADPEGYFELYENDLEAILFLDNDSAYYKFNRSSAPIETSGSTS
jgi:hypothetical protein